MKNMLFLPFCLLSLLSFSQEMKLEKAISNGLSGSEFAKTIIDTSLSLLDREELIFSEIKKGNVPAFLRTLTRVEIEKVIDGKSYQLRLYVTPDYIAIGNNNDYFYTPTTPMLAQKIADLTKTILPTKLLVDEIYRQAKIKLAPNPIPPTKAMTTVPVFILHHQMILKQLEAFQQSRQMATLTAGHKKDIIISNKIYGEPTPRVVIYGWHKLDGKAIQPVYNKHTNTWADYSHGLRLVSEIAYLNGKKMRLSALLKHPVLHQLISDEGTIAISKYPVQ